MREIYGYSTAKSMVLFNGNENSGCVFYSGIHDYFRRLSLGYSRNRVHLVQEVRWQRMSVIEARMHELNDLINFSFDKKIIRRFSEFLDIRTNALYALLKSFSNSKYWLFTDNNIRYIGPLLQNELSFSHFNDLPLLDFKESSAVKVEYSKSIILSPGVPY